MIKAIRKFASEYADQTEAGFAIFEEAIKSGKIKLGKDRPGST